jgi:hypothetical protein
MFYQSRSRITFQCGTHRPSQYVPLWNATGGINVLEMLRFRVFVWYTPYGGCGDGPHGDGPRHQMLFDN